MSDAEIEYALYSARRLTADADALVGQQSPGPGSYSIRDVPFLALEKIRPLGGTFGHAKRSTCDRSVCSDDVGPGAYDSQPKLTSRGPCFSFGRSPRCSDGPRRRSRSEERPGPGAYDALTLFDVKRHTVTSSFSRMTSPRLGTRRSLTPGPGAYDGCAASNRVRSSSPQFSFGKSERRNEREPTPGPGEYVVDLAPKAPTSLAGNLSRSPRMPLDKSEGAGPGAYNTELTERRTLSIPTAGRKPLHELKLTPGPGAYDVVKKRDIRQVLRIEHILPHTGFEARAVTPGPGQYELSRRAAETPSWSMTSRPVVSFARQNSKDVPGPGQYVTSSAAERVRGGAIDTGKRDPTKPPLVPGPGAYDTTSNQAANNASSFPSAPRLSSHFVDAKRAYVPGPGSYTPEEQLPQHMAIFGSSNRGLTDVSPVDDTPGPGSYENSDQSPAGHAVALPQAGRRELFPTQATPGPGAYTTEVKPKDGVSMKFHIEGPAPSSSAAPGPGAYTVQDTSASVSYSFAHGSRLPEQKQTGPGPGAYEGQRVHDDRAAVFGNAAREGPAPEKYYVPGPGAYNTDTVRTVQGTFFPDSIRVIPQLEGNPTASPGPAAYVVSVPPSGPSYTMGSAAADMAGAPTPGPGQYEITPQGQHGKAVPFPTAQRAQPAPEPTPGPGSYTPEIAVMDHAAVFGTSLKYTPDSNPTPGPGAYAGFEVHTNVQGGYIPAPSTSNCRGEARRHDETPGPAHYVLDQSKNDTVHTYSFSIAGREPQPPSSVLTPGPGSYDAAGREHVRGGLIGGVPHQIDATSKQPTPGPGAYTYSSALGGPAVSVSLVGHHDGTSYVPLNTNPGPGAYSTTYPHDGGADGGVIGTAQKKSSFDRTTDVPGPGAYQHDPSEQSTAPSYTFSARHADVRPSADVPGPGAYDTSQLRQGSDGYTVPKAPRSRDAIAGRRDEPGPGAYQPNYAPDVRDVTIPTAQRELHDLKHSAATPGPGQYAAASGDTGGPQWTMTSRLPDADLQYLEKQRAALPGPGAYMSIHNAKVMGGIMGMPSAESNIQAGALATPGPGAYATGMEGATAAGHRGGYIGIAARTRDGAAVDATPGPGAYEGSSRTTDEAPITAILNSAAARFTEPSTRLVPGPGSYNTEPPPPQLPPGFTVPKSNRGDPNADKHQDTPGPGAYTASSNVTMEHVPGPNLGQSSARMPDSATDVPGPGMYAAEAVVSGQSTAGGYIPRAHRGEGIDPSKKTDETAPGPGAYSVGSQEASAPGASFATSQRPGLEAPSAKSVPGPGAYDPRRYLAVPGGVITSAGMLPTPEEREAMAKPGPGHYAPDPNDLGGPRKVRGGYMAVSNTHLNNSRDFETDAPGPGAYYVEGPSTAGPMAPGFTIPMSTYDPAASSTSVAPGPGQYGDVVFRPHGPMATMALPHPVADPRASNPGPGSYYAKVDMKTGPVISIGGTPAKPRPREPLPGPGEYEIDRYGQKKNPGVSFSKVERSSLLDPKGETPGPADYNNNPRDDRGRIGPEFSKYSARKPASDGDGPDMPGPGEYPIPSMIGGDGSGARSFEGYSGRRVDGKSDSPGPGTYYYYYDEGRGVPILNRFPEKYHDNLPAPGHYNPRPEVAAKYFPYDPSRYCSTAQMESGGGGGGQQQQQQQQRSVGGVPGTHLNTNAGM